MSFLSRVFSGSYWRSSGLRPTKHARSRRRSVLGRLPRLEPLEDRRLLSAVPLANSPGRDLFGDGGASVLVTTADDLVNEYDGKVSLREAVNYANSHSGADTITFDASLAGQTITLSAGEL